MGMYDYVNYSMNCPNCGTTIYDFQSKDKSCDLNVLEINEINRFYSSCYVCGLWIEFNLRKNSKITIDNFIMTTRK